MCQHALYLVIHLSTPNIQASKYETLNENRKLNFKLEVKSTSEYLLHNTEVINFFVFK